MTHSYSLDSGAFVPSDGIPVTDRGFRYGMSVFESIALRDSRPLLLDRHVEKLIASVERVRFRPPLEWPAAIASMLASPPIPEGMARIYITAGDGGFDLQVARSRVVMTFESMPIPAQETLAECKALTIPFLPGLPPGKTGNYWSHLIAHAHAGVAEAVLLTPEGSVLSGAMSNLFFVIDGELRTPQGNDDIRLGVVHDWITEHHPVTACHVAISDLEHVQDAFLTNSRLGILRIADLDEIPLEGHPLVDAIWLHYRSEVLNAGGG